MQKILAPSEMGLREDLLTLVNRLLPNLTQAHFGRERLDADLDQGRRCLHFV
ncbi:hypothetical protein [Phyllobacterium brassicacearum]|uniref:hypothetical protein n=1 Tax=Phyllobacterium brassicacearum TaxID=314235 RepID=UPI0010E256FD|nr:hypothetical protein [Phyllobacterium brassicacearum]TDQ27975.1 hypothetical protein DEV91_11127 [Phyllobacterium brassicacearum]